MKNLKNIVTSLTFVLVVLISFNVDAQGKKVTKKDADYISSEFKKGMVSFVESVQPFYQKGSSYESFVKELKGGNSTDMPREGEVLLNKAYEYLSNGVSSKDILSKDSGKEIGRALVFVDNYNRSNKASNGDEVLFGIDKLDEFEGKSNGVQSKKDCKWYQIGCHLSNIWNWIKDNWETIVAIIDQLFDWGVL